MTNGAHYFLFGRVDGDNPLSVMHEKGFVVELPTYIVDVKKDPKTGECMRAAGVETRARGGDCITGRAPSDADAGADPRVDPRADPRSGPPEPGPEETAERIPERSPERTPERTPGRTPEPKGSQAGDQVGGRRHRQAGR